MKYLLMALMATFAFACNGSKNGEETDSFASADTTDLTKQQYPELLQRALEAHGGLDKWQSYSTLRFDLSQAGSKRTERHTVNLKNRMVRIDGDNFSIGMDGKEVWASPTIKATGKSSPRFYHNLFFYFYTIPFVLADEGINYEELGQVMVDSVTYNALKISFNKGVGDADQDIYIAHFNLETNQLELLLYTVTFYSGEAHENYNAILYKDYEEVGGLLMPNNLQGYKYQGDTLAELRYNIFFKMAKFAKSAPEKKLFVMPKEAEIDSLKPIVN